MKNYEKIEAVLMGISTVSIILGKVLKNDTTFGRLSACVGIISGVSMIAVTIKDIVDYYSNDKEMKMLKK